MTRQQAFLGQALDRVTEVQQWSEEEAKKKYGAFCHKLPSLIRSCGLCQSLAFLEERANAGKDPQQKKALGRIREDVAVALECNANQIMGRVRDADVVTYMMMTRQVLSAMAYYKRFAVSILGVEADAGESD